MTLTVEANLDALVNQAVPVHAGTHSGLIEQVGRPFFNDTGANSAQDIVGAALLEDDVRYAVLAQQLAQQQAGRAGADNDDLSTRHGGIAGSISALHTPI
jgi:hypothetical protein